MTEDSHASPGTTRRSRGPWRVGTPLVVLACGVLFVTSAANSGGTDLRPGRYADLASLVAAENREYQRLEARVQEVSRDVERLTAQVGDPQVQQLRRQVERLQQPAGLRAVSGPGLTITLSDAPEDVINASTGDLNLLVVHQQDLQAVANALWKGGAEAMTIQGRRVVTTTGIKCEGNAVLLQGRAYPQPYTISAIGNPAALEAAVLQDDYLEAYREDAATPEVSVGWEMQAESELAMPAYDGLTNLSHAQPIR
ncbi:DUF881 domain-containing protein [Nocardioides coralli]|uniref:DUF881 domain-containing protein n=1 Tax=Nocardioides coralli TaxID=2872154 RepID=UPI001CA39AF6|nr:DUF881 domain-containing protein [Nocardioides coralli]QZY29178.1 DUF881 domain-containing protein [Nocardioides coralli]